MARTLGQMKRRWLALTALVAALSGVVVTTTSGATNAASRAAIYSIRDDGTKRRLIARPEPAVPDLVRSPGGRSILYTRDVDGLVALFAADTSGENEIRLTPPEMWIHTYPIGTFSPDGRLIAFTSLIECGYRCYEDGVWVVRRDGSGLRLLAEYAAEPSWAPDSRRLAYVGVRGTYDSSGIYVIDVQSYKRTLVARGSSRGAVAAPQWAPRGERIAYTASIRGHEVACFVNANGSKRRCTRGHSLSWLVWSHDAKRVAFRQATPRRLGFVDPYARRVHYLGNHGRFAHPEAWSPESRRLAFSVGFPDYDSVRVLRIAAPKRSFRAIDETNPVSDVRWHGRELSYVVDEAESP